jgi:hypothetical protein
MTPRFRSLVARLFGEVPPAPPPRPTFELLPPAPPWRPGLGETVWVEQREGAAGQIPYSGPAAVVAIGMGGLLFRVRPDTEAGQAYSFGATIGELHPIAIAEDVLELVMRLEADAG